MTQTQTFSMWFGDFIAEYYKGTYEGQRLGQAFIDALHKAGRHALANSFIYSAVDPFYHDEVPAESIAFAERNWNFMVG